MSNEFQQTLIESLRKQGFLPVPVQVLGDLETTSRLFLGSLEDYIEAAKALGAKVVFVETLHLEEDEFIYQAEIDEDCDDECCGGGHCCRHADSEDEWEEELDGDVDEDVDGEIETEVAEADGEDAEFDEDDGIWIDAEDLDGFDLCVIEPALEEFRARIGDECGVRLSLPGVDRLEVEVYTDWYDQFAALADSAEEQIEMDPGAVLEKFQKGDL